MIASFPGKSAATALVATLTVATLVAAGPASNADAPEASDTSDAARLSIDGADTAINMSEDLYGVFYEDINYAADGGLYAELVRNRSFEFNASDHSSFNALTAWTVAGGATMSMANDAGRLNHLNRQYLVLNSPSAGGALINSSYNEGVALESSEIYDFSVWARSSSAQTLVVSVTDASGATSFASGVIDVDASNEWKQYTVSLTSSGTTNAGRLRVEATSPGTMNLDMVSLFPRDQYVGPVNGAYGLRKDLVERIDDLNPSFLRFPGGCVTNVGTFRSYEESGYTDRRRTYQWKETIGPVEERPTNWNIWGYNQSYGIGYLEYFKLAEDLGAFPLPVVSVGANGCGSNIPELTDQGSELFDRWVQDTVDLIEFAIGDESTEWGGIRADLGHPEPFELPYIGLGNEENTPTFEANFPLFRDAIEERFPQVEIISNSGPSASGGRFNTLWDFNRAQDVVMVDEHYYMEPNWFLENTNRYDSYDREGPHVFLGEYAARGNAVRNALAEAAYLTGIERNSDVVELASYAPLLANEDYVQWSPDAIWFDNDESWGSVNYWVQHMFSNNRGSQVVPSTYTPATGGADDLSGGVLLSTWQTAASYDDLVVTGANDEVLFADDFAGGAGAWTPSSGNWAVNAGRYAQSSTTVTDARSFVTGSYGNDWSNYTVELNATKQSGAEGFLIGFAAEATGDYYWWNLGGWGNTRSALEKATGGSRGPVKDGPATTIVNGREYEIRIEVKGSHIDLYLDDVLHISYDEPVTSDVYQVVTRDVEASEILVKAVNVGDNVHPLNVVVDDVSIEPDGATVLEMVGPSQSATNTKANPDAIVPVDRPFDAASNDFVYELPARSITFLTLPYSVAPEPADTAVLVSAIADAGVVDRSKFTAGSLADLDAAVVAGEAVLADDEATQGEVDAAATAVTDAITGLVEIVVPPVVTYVDVNEDSKFFAEISWLTAEGISTGWSTPAGREYRPFDTINRDAMAAFLYRSAGSPQVQLPATSPFSDITPQTKFYKEMVWMYQEDISRGWYSSGGDRTYRPLQPITREAIAAFLYRAAGKPGWTAPSASPFKDLKKTDNFYKEITWLADAGITTGWSVTGGKEFRPDNLTRRDAMAAFLYRYHQNVN